MSGLQTISKSGIKNRTYFGAELQLHCRRAETRFRAAGHGYVDGGCLTLAVAIQTWSDGRTTLAAVGPTKPRRRAAHVTAKVGTHYLDSEGIGMAADLLLRASFGLYLPNHKIFQYSPSHQHLAGSIRSMLDG